MGHVLGAIGPFGLYRFPEEQMACGTEVFGTPQNSERSLATSADETPEISSAADFYDVPSRVGAR